jgi:hypothetical protein
VTSIAAIAARQDRIPIVPHMLTSSFGGSWEEAPVLPVPFASRSY